jgi:negative regulator of sigma E activity
MTQVKQWFRKSGALALATGASLAVGACGISTQQELEMGQQYSAEIARQLPIMNDAAVNNTSTPWAGPSRSRAAVSLPTRSTW